MMVIREMIIYNKLADYDIMHQLNEWALKYYGSDIRKVSVDLSDFNRANVLDAWKEYYGGK
jgi:hypothetical protein